MSNKQQRKIYILADSHIQHDAIREYCNRPNNCDELLYKNWKHIIREKDILIHLGDVIFYGNKQYFSNILQNLPGTKILIRGNHDKNHSDTWFLDCGFSAVFKQVIINNYILSHSPVPIYDIKYINIHGHLHNNPLKDWEKAYGGILTDNHYLLSLEYVNYKPILLKTAIEKKEVIKTKFMN
jgi:calcineurin-like phosphoesterase family protein